MTTIYIPDSHMDLLIADLSKRMFETKNPPTHFFSVGISGDWATHRLLDNLKYHNILDEIKVTRLIYNKETAEITYRDHSDRDNTLSPKSHSLILFGIINSGITASAIYRKLCASNTPSIRIYSFVVRSNSIIVPNYFGVMVNPDDTVYFDRKFIPNQFYSKEIPGILRRINQFDVDDSSFDCGNPDLNPDFGDLYYESEALGYGVYVYECNGKIVAYVKFKSTEDNSIFIDKIGADKSVIGLGIGGSIMRFIEIYARTKGYNSIKLMALEDVVNLYTHFGYLRTGRAFLFGDKSPAFEMERPIFPRS